MRRARHPALLTALLLVLAAPAAPAAPVSELRYTNGATELAASLLVPDGEGPFPAVVLVHGSGSSDRSNPWTSAYASALVARGIVVLHPDKRGSGESTGDWRRASFHELAGDVVAAVEALLASPAVDSSRVGLIGFSQGGHVVPLAASMSPEVDLVVSISASVVPILEQVGDELRLMAEREGFSESQRQLVASIHERAVAFALEGGAAWGAYMDALQSAEDMGLGDSEVVSGFPRERSSPAWEFLRTVGDFDPLPYWESLELPAVFVYGGRDRNVDVPRSTAILEGALSRAGLPYSLLLFRENGHALYREDLIAFLAEWLGAGGAH